MTFIHGAGISQAVQSITPRRVAVAYLGQDWDKYLTSLEVLEAIVISPTIGTNPWAVRQLVKRLERDGQSGWERVHFLDKLHAKLYLGDAACVLGSANLTANGLSGDGLIEAALLTTNVTQLASAGEFFNYVMRKAISAYPDAHSKERRLLQLDTEHAASISHRTPRKGDDTDKRERSIRDLIDPLPVFHVCWYTYTGPDLEQEAVKALSFDIGRQLHFHPEDAIKTGQWVLTWPLTNKDKMDRRTMPSWMYIDHIHDDILDLADDPDYPYKKVALQKVRAGAEREALLTAAPFHINPAFATAMAVVLANDSPIREALVQPESDHATTPWQLNKASKKVAAFVGAVQQELSRRR